MAASGSFSSSKYKNFDIFEKNIKYVYTRNMFNKSRNRKYTEAVVQKYS